MTTETRNSMTADDGTSLWWLKLADDVDQHATRAGRIAHAAVVRAAIGEHIDRLVRWNTRICDMLDVAIASAPA